MPKFKIKINLDDSSENYEFTKKFAGCSGRQIAQRIGFKGKGSAIAANALKNYAENKRTAMSLRKLGKIDRAMVYEKICDEIYNEDIYPNIECW